MDDPVLAVDAVTDGAVVDIDALVLCITSFEGTHLSLVNVENADEQIDYPSTFRAGPSGAPCRLYGELGRFGLTNCKSGSLLDWEEALLEVVGRYYLARTRLSPGEPYTTRELLEALRRQDLVAIQSLLAIGKEPPEAGDWGTVREMTPSEARDWLMMFDLPVPPSLGGRADPCPVELFGRGEAPRVMGLPVPPLSEKMYCIIEALAGAYSTRGLTRGELADLTPSPREAIRDFLGKLNTDSPWHKVLHYQRGTKGAGTGRHFLASPT